MNKSTNAQMNVLATKQIHLRMNDLYKTEN